MQKINSIAVFCGSKTGNNSKFISQTIELGNFLGEKNIKLIYGGGKVGLMGAVANATLQTNGQVVGIIPEVLVEWEQQHNDITELIVVDNMHVRKKMMYELSDAAIILPGGYGTLDELFEAITLIQTNKVAHFPIILAGKKYWEGLLTWVKETMLLEEHNISEKDLDLFKIVDTADEAVAIINEFYSKYLLKPNF